MTDHTNQILHLAAMDQQLPLMADELKLLHSFLAKAQSDQGWQLDDRTQADCGLSPHDREVALTSIAGSLRRKGLDDAKLVSTLNILNRGFPDPLPAEQVAILAAEVARNTSQSDDQVLAERFEAAIHEAAHAVTVNWFAGSISEAGVQIASVGRGTVDCTGFSFHPRFYTKRANVCVSCAGFVAELMTLEDPAIAAGLQQSDDDLMEVIERFLGRDYEPELWAECGDAGNAFARILSRVPEPSDLEAIAMYRQYEQETKMILTRSDVWAAVQLVAAKLLDQGRLSEQEVDACLEQISPRLVGGFWWECTAALLAGDRQLTAH